MALDPYVDYRVIPQCAPDMCVGLSSAGIPVLQPVASGATWGTFEFWRNACATGMGLMFRARDASGDFVYWQLGIDLYNVPVPSLVLAPDPASPYYATWNLLPNGDFFAVQNTNSTGLNLNVAGNGPYPAGTPILAWSWGGGAPNELWRFVAV